MTYHKRNQRPFWFIVKAIVIVIVLAATLASCDTIARKFYGIKDIEGFDSTEYNAFIDKIPDNIAYTSIVGKIFQFNELVSAVDDTIMLKHLHQPVQMLYFQNDSLVSYHINCTAPAKWRGIDWNYEGRFDTFPPLSAISCHNSRLSFSEFERAYGLSGDKNKTILVVLWTTAFEKISLDAITTAFNNIAEYDRPNETDVFLINNDEVVASGFGQ